MRDLELLIKDYRLTTAEILYHMPDHPSLLQTYVWQGLLSGKPRWMGACTASRWRAPRSSSPTASATLGP
jgi:hypothetical protein